MTTTKNSDTFRARVDNTIAVIREWQRGGMSWNAIQCRADLTTAEMVAIKDRLDLVTSCEDSPRTKSADQIRAIVCSAFGRR